MVSRLSHHSRTLLYCVSPLTSNPACTSCSIAASVSPIASISVEGRERRTWLTCAAYGLTQREEGCQGKYNPVSMPPFCVEHPTPQISNFQVFWKWERAKNVALSGFRWFWVGDGTAWFRLLYHLHRKPIAYFACFSTLIPPKTFKKNLHFITHQ